MLLAAILSICHGGLTWLPSPTPRPMAILPMMSIPMSMAAAQRAIPTMKQAPAIKIVAFLPIFLQVWLPLRILNAFTT